MERLDTNADQQKKDKIKKVILISVTILGLAVRYFLRPPEVTEEGKARAKEVFAQMEMEMKNAQGNSVPAVVPDSKPKKDTPSKSEGSASGVNVVSAAVPAESKQNAVPPPTVEVAKASNVPTIDAVSQTKAPLVAAPPVVSQEQSISTSENAENQVVPVSNFIPSTEVSLDLSNSKNFLYLRTQYAVVKITLIEDLSEGQITKLRNSLKGACLGNEDPTIRRCKKSVVIDDSLVAKIKEMNSIGDLDFQPQIMADSVFIENTDKPFDFFLGAKNGWKDASWAVKSLEGSVKIIGGNIQLFRLNNSVAGRSLATQSNEKVQFTTLIQRVYLTFRNQ